MVSRKEKQTRAEWSVCFHSLDVMVLACTGLQHIDLSCMRCHRGKSAGRLEGCQSSISVGGNAEGCFGGWGARAFTSQQPSHLSLRKCDGRWQQRTLCLQTNTSVFWLWLFPPPSVLSRAVGYCMPVIQMFWVSAEELGAGQMPLWPRLSNDPALCSCSGGLAATKGLDTILYI